MTGNLERAIRGYSRALHNELRDFRFEAMADFHVLEKEFMSLEVRMTIDRANMARVHRQMDRAGNRVDRRLEVGTGNS